MEKLYGNYLGLCINNDDPQKRGRVQIFIPPIMPALYENWNKEGDDISMLCVGDNIPDSLPTPIVEKLMKILPWAESASPILGASAPGDLVNNQYNQSPVPDARDGGTLGGYIPGVTGIGSEDALLQEALKYAGGGSLGSTVRSLLTTPGASGGGACGRGTCAVVGALTGNSRFTQGSAGGNADDFSLNGGLNFVSSGIYQGKQTLPSNYLNDPTQWRVGDIVASDSSGNGHIQVWTGKQWVSDFQQGHRILTGGYSGFALHRLNPEGERLVQARANSLFGGLVGGPGQPAPSEGETGSGLENASTSGTVAAPTPHQDQISLDANFDLTNPGYASIARPEVGLAPGISSDEISPGVPRTPEQAPNFDIAKAKQALKVQTDTEAKNAAEVYSAAYNNLVSRDISGDKAKILASGIVGNVKQETGFNPNKTHDGNTGYGLLGWASRPGDQRLNNLVQFAQSRGEATGVNFTTTVNPQSIVSSGGISIKTQIDFLFGEFDGANGFYNQADSNNSRFWNGFTSSNSPAEAALFLSNKVVRPSLRYARNDVRQNTAEAAAEALGGLDPSTFQFSGPSAAEAGIGQQSSSLVNNTDKHGTMAVVNMNNMAKGVFAYPAAGALLWVFFREGNPNYPVYFAANYGEREWASAFRLGSEGEGYSPAPKPDKPATSTGVTINWGFGGIKGVNTTVPEDPTKDQKSLTIFAHDGSNMHFNEGYHQIFSKFDRRDSVEGDRWETTLGFKEEWVQGDSNEVCMGDVFVKIGNVSPPAVDAVTRIQQIIKECMQPVTQGSDGGGSDGTGTGTSGSGSGSSTTARGGSGKSSFTKAAANISQVPSTTVTTNPAESINAIQNAALQNPVDFIRNTSTSLNEPTPSSETGAGRFNARNPQTVVVSRQIIQDEYGTPAERAEQERQARLAGF